MKWSGGMTLKGENPNTLQKSLSHYHLDQNRREISRDQAWAFA